MASTLRKAVLTSSAATFLFITSSASAIDPNATGGSSPVPVMTASDTGTSGNKGFLSGVLGCGASGNKQTIGAVAGGVLGGFLGNRIAGRGSRTLGTLLGGALGAAAGSWLGCKLQTNDQQKAQAALENAVATGKDQSWDSAESGASGKVVVTGAPGLADLKFAANVEPANGYTKVAGAFVSTANANIRSAPATSGRILGQLTTGQRVWVPAQVQGQPWVLISENGIAQGYVAKSLLKQESTATASNCKLVKQTISVPGSSDETETLQACKDSTGQWVMTRV